MRKIIHCDCDCFYASVEIRDNKALQFLPVAVGGSSTGRGVVTTCTSQGNMGSALQCQRSQRYAYAQN